MPKPQHPMKVVVNHEERIRIVRAERTSPGWRELGKQGSLEELLETARELAASGDNRVDMDQIEELLDEEDRTTSTAGEHNPNR